MRTYGWADARKKMGGRGQTRAIEKKPTHRDKKKLTHNAQKKIKREGQTREGKIQKKVETQRRASVSSLQVQPTPLILERTSSKREHVLERTCSKREHVLERTCSKREHVLERTKSISLKHQSGANAIHSRENMF